MGDSEEDDQPSTEPAAVNPLEPYAADFAQMAETLRSRAQAEPTSFRDQEGLIQNFDPATMGETLATKLVLRFCPTGVPAPRVCVVVMVVHTREGMRIAGYRTIEIHGESEPLIAPPRIGALADIVVGAASEDECSLPQVAPHQRPLLFGEDTMWTEGLATCADVAAALSPPHTLDFASLHVQYENALPGYGMLTARVESGAELTLNFFSQYIRP